ncbi:hypothetical protein CR513_04628, partial [Mucuna pruriens]
MSRTDIKFEDKILRLLFFNFLLEYCETFMVSITNSTHKGVVSLQMTKGNILNEEMRRNAQDTRMWSITIKHCFLWKKENKGKKGKSKEKDNDNDDDDDVATVIGDDLVILRDFESVKFIYDESMWIIDSDATLTPRKEFFTSYTLGELGVLKMGNDGTIKVIDVGNTYLQTKIGVQLWLRGVKHAPDVCFNLISMHMLDDDGYDNHFGYEKWKLTKALVAKDSANVMDIEASLWHRRLSHINEKWLNCLAKKDMLQGLKNAKLEKCFHCMASKQTRVPFKKHHPSRKSELLELVHSDVCDSLKIKSFSGSLYFVTFIDDCSRKLWVYVLKAKDQVLEKFKQFQTLVER